MSPSHLVSSHRATTPFVGNGEQWRSTAGTDSGEPDRRSTAGTDSGEPERTVEAINGTYSSRSHATMTTLDRIQQNRRRAPQPGSMRSYFDSTSPSYGWLLPGWIAEERVMENGRLYKYFYDPFGYQYRAMDEVLYLWEEAGLIVLDL